MSLFKKIYISCPQQIPYDHLKDYVKIIVQRRFLLAECWNRVSYDPSMLENADYFAIMLPNNKFKMHIDDLPVDCKKELLKAIDLGKKLLLCYESQLGKNVYKAEIINNVIQGIAGTSDILAQIDISMQDLNKNDNVGKNVVKIHVSNIEEHIYDNICVNATISTSNPDSRLLLLM